MTITNTNVETGIAYGCISQHTVNPDALSDIFDNGENLTYESAKADVKASLRSALSDYFSDYRRKRGYGDFSEQLVSDLDEAVDDAFDAIADSWNDGYESCGEDQYLYQEDGYKISTSASLVCLFVEDSPYYTHARYCSPCAPGAGDLDSTNTDGARTYCLGHEWFENDTAPYKVYRVADDSEVPNRQPLGVSNESGCISLQSIIRLGVVLACVWAIARIGGAF